MIYREYSISNLNLHQCDLIHQLWNIILSVVRDETTSELHSIRQKIVDDNLQYLTVVISVPLNIYLVRLSLLKNNFCFRIPSTVKVNQVPFDLKPSSCLFGRRFHRPQNQPNQPKYAKNITFHPQVSVMQLRVWVPNINHILAPFVCWFGFSPTSEAPIGTFLFVSHQTRFPLHLIKTGY